VDAGSFTNDSKKLIYGYLGTPLDTETPRNIVFVVYDIETETETLIPIKGYDCVIACFFSPECEYIGVHTNTAIDFYNAVTYEQIIHLEVDSNFNYALDAPEIHDDFVAKDKIVVAGPGSLHFCNLSTTNVNKILDDPDATVVAVSMINEQHFCTAMKNEILIWDVEKLLIDSRYPTRGDLQAFSNYEYDFVLGFGSGNVDFITFYTSLE